MTEETQDYQFDIEKPFYAYAAQRLETANYYSLHCLVSGFFYAAIDVEELEGMLKVTDEYKGYKASNYDGTKAITTKQVEKDLLDLHECLDNQLLLCSRISPIVLASKGDYSRLTDRRQLAILLGRVYTRTTQNTTTTQAKRLSDMHQLRVIGMFLQELGGPGTLSPTLQQLFDSLLYVQDTHGITARLLSTKERKNLPSLQHGLDADAINSWLKEVLIRLDKINLPVQVSNSFTKKRQKAFDLVNIKPIVRKVKKTSKSRLSKMQLDILHRLSQSQNKKGFI